MTQIDEVKSLKNEYIGLSAVTNFLYHTATTSEERGNYNAELDEINNAIRMLNDMEEELSND